MATALSPASRVYSSCVQQRFSSSGLWPLAAVADASVAQPDARLRACLAAARGALLPDYPNDENANHDGCEVTK
jgi:hypothetical protein